MSRSTSVRFGAEPNPLLTRLNSRKAMGLSDRGAETFFGETHEAIERETDDADGENAEDDVLVNERVVFLPEEAADAGRAGEHFRADDHEPGDPETETEAGEHVGQGRGEEDFEERFSAREFQHFSDVQEVL